MNKFWKYIQKYFRFLLSSGIGLIFGLLTPFKNLKKLKIFFLFILIICLIIFYFVFKNMFVF